MKALLTLIAIVLALPVLLLIGIAMGPAALVLLFIAGFATLTFLVGGALRRGNG